MTTILNRAKSLHESRGGQLPDLGSIVTRGAERNGKCVTPQSACHELLGFWIAGLMSKRPAMYYVENGGGSSAT